MIGGGMGIGGLVLLVVMMLAGVDPGVILQQPGGPGGPGGNVGPDQRIEANRIDPEQEELVDFTRVILGSTEDVWREQFRAMGRQYRDPKLELFTGQTHSACGGASSAMGPFYCPADQQVYIDLQFYDELRRRFRAPGDTAQAYVIAHEVGHHVQNLLGYSDQVERLRRRASEQQANELSVRLELQADYLAGVWAHHAHRADPNLFEPGDIEEALRAAQAIGDDRLQMQSQGYVVPDSFQHGSSAQRERWFRRGYESGDLDQLGHFFESDEL